MKVLDVSFNMRPILHEMAEELNNKAGAASSGIQQYFGSANNLQTYS